MNEVGIYLNLDKKESHEMARKCIVDVREQGLRVALLEDQLKDFGDLEDPGLVSYSKALFFDVPDCIVVLGGDGTLLSVARRSCLYEMPLFGINLGKLGFLTEGEVSNYKTLLEVLCKGESYLEKRMMLTCKIYRENGDEESYLALNDVLVKNAGFRMMELRAYAGDNVMDVFRADGLIIATPTGSTAYSLAAGGPVVAPGTDVMIVNPVCPHRLHDRAYVISADEDIHIRFDEKERDIIVSIDGQTIVPIGACDEVVIEKAPYTTNLIRLNGISFYDRLRKKLSDDVVCDENRR
ncbi:MAG: NAD(+)/NADH kinase [Eubacterium sp.]